MIRIRHTWLLKLLATIKKKKKEKKVLVYFDVFRKSCCQKSNDTAGNHNAP